MIAEIESILGADDRAREEVEAAWTEAKRIETLARRQAEEAVFNKKRELSELLGAETESIVEEARSRSRRVLEEASQYMQALQDRKSALLDDLVEDLLGKVTGA